MTGRARPAVAVVLVSLIAAMLCWPTAVAALVPVANPDAITVQKNAAATPVDVLLNDTHDPTNPWTTSIVSATDPAHGTVVIDLDGLGLTYPPDTYYTGQDPFQGNRRDAFRRLAADHLGPNGISVLTSRRRASRRYG